jgi:hypothetical protein
MVQYLVERGALVDKGNADGKTPLIAAAKKGNMDMVEYLVERGADINKGERFGDTALIVASRIGNSDMVRCLVALHADINLGANDGETPLAYAAWVGDLEMMRCLVELGASVESVDGDGNTVLINLAHLTRLGHYSTVQFLIEELGASTEAVDSDGKTVWDHLAIRIKRVIAADFDEADPCLTALMRLLVLHKDPPPALVELLSLIALLSPENTRVEQEGARLQAQLPAYLVRRRALLDANCPLLPPLCAIVHDYMELTTEEAWATGLGAGGEGNMLL